MKKRKEDKVPYQTVKAGGKSFPGRFDTEKMFASLDIRRQLYGKSFIDLGCNRGGLVFLAEENGAALTIGVDVASRNIEEAQAICTEVSSKSKFYCASIQEFVPTMARYDFVACTAVFRHLYADLLQEVAPERRKGRGFLVLDSLDVLIRQNVGDPPEAIARYNQLIEGMLGASNERFICSFNDESGLIFRRQGEVAQYFRERTDRVECIETFVADYTNPKFVVVDIKLNSE